MASRLAGTEHAQQNPQHLFFSVQIVNALHDFGLRKLAEHFRSLRDGGCFHSHIIAALRVLSVLTWS